MIKEFHIKNDICHNDTTSASTYGNCDNNKTQKKTGSIQQFNLLAVMNVRTKGENI